MVPDPFSSQMSSKTKQKLRLSSNAPKQIDSLFLKVGKRRAGRSLCFLCGKKLDKANRSDEHVFPTWLQKRFNLWNQELILLNGTSIPYRQITIPCCKTCNNVYLGRIEKAVEVAVSSGAKAVRGLSPVILLVWLSKILYGVLYREHLLHFDRKTRVKGRLVPKTFLAKLLSFYLFLQAARVDMKFMGFFPASIFVFDVQVPQDVRIQFDFTDSPVFLAVACRLGGVGIIAALQDGGAQKVFWGKQMTRFQSLHLHPTQFSELVTRVFYQASLFNRIPKYLTIETDGKYLVHQMPLQGLSTKPIYDKGDVYTYARFLSVRTGYPLGQLYKAPDKVRTFLEDSKGKLIKWDVGDGVWEVRDRVEIENLLARIGRKFIKDYLR